MQVETAGDCYIVSGGVLSPTRSSDGFELVVDQNHDPAASAKRVMAFAKAMLEAAEQVKMYVCMHLGVRTGSAC